MSSLDFIIEIFQKEKKKINFIVCFVGPVLAKVVFAIVEACVMFSSVQDPGLI